MHQQNIAVTLDPEGYQHVTRSEHRNLCRAVLTKPPSDVWRVALWVAEIDEALAVAQSRMSRSSDPVCVSIVEYL